MLHERVDGGACVIIALVGEKNILLIKDLSKIDPKWKLIAETVKPGESYLHTVLAGLTEEAGMKDIKTELGPDNKVARFTDPRILGVVQFGEPEYVRSKIPHYRYFYGVFTTDEVISSLSGETHHIEEDDGKGGRAIEHIETMHFPLTALESVRDLLRPHAELIRSIPNRQKIDIC